MLLSVKRIFWILLTTVICSLMIDQCACLTILANILNPQFLLFKVSPERIEICQGTKFLIFIS